MSFAVSTAVLCMLLGSAWGWSGTGSQVTARRLHSSLVRGPLAQPRRGVRGFTIAPSMAVGDIQTLDWADVKEVQEGLKQCMADGNRVIELEVPTTDRFKDAALNQIYQANTIYARELVRMFTQPQELCMVFPDVQECKYAIEEWGGDVPFKLSSLVKPQTMQETIDKYVVMHPVFDVREYAQMDQLYSDEIQPRGGSLIVFNGDLFKLRSGGLTGYYPDIFFPKLAEVRRRLMPQVQTAYYLRIFRGPPVGALYRKYPGPWQVLRALEGNTFDVLAEFVQQVPPTQDEVFKILQKAGAAPITEGGSNEKDRTLSRMGISTPSEPLDEPVAGSGWTAAVDPESGKTYYYNDKGETSWDRPA